MLTHIIPCFPCKLPGYMNRTLTLDVTYNLRDRIFRRYRDHHMHVIRHYMAFFYQAFLLPGQPVKNLSKFPPNLAE